MPTRRPHTQLRLALSVALVCLVAAPAAQATFPGPDGAIAFDSGGSRGEISAMRQDGSEVRNLTRTCDRSESSADWSPDGSRLAYTFGDRVPGDPVPGGGVSAIAILSRDGRSTIDVPAAPSGPPEWSPDGSRFVWAADDDIYVVNTDGSGLTNLTNTPTNEGTPAWSPDGAKIAFAAPGGQGVLLYTMDPSGANRVQLSQPSADGSSSLDFSPDWSPDGTRIVFVRQMVGSTPQAARAGIYVIPSTGGSPTALVGPVAGPSPASPSWSPSGTKIAFVGPDLTGVWTMNADGSAQTKINSTITGAAVDWGSSLSYGGIAGPCAKSPTPKAFGRLTRVRNGVAWVLGCPASASIASRCSVSVQLSTKPAERRGRGARLLGRKKAPIPAGKKGKVVARLNAAGKRSLRNTGKLAVRVKAVVRYGKGALATRKTAVRSIVLRAPRKHPSTRRAPTTRR